MTLHTSIVLAIDVAANHGPAIDRHVQCLCFGTTTNKKTSLKPWPNRMQIALVCIAFGRNCEANFTLIA